MVLVKVKCSIFFFIQLNILFTRMFLRPGFAYDEEKERWRGCGMKQENQLLARKEGAQHRFEARDKNVIFFVLLVLIRVFN